MPALAREGIHCRGKKKKRSSKYECRWLFRFRNIVIELTMVSLSYLFLFYLLFMSYNSHGGHQAHVYVNLYCALEDGERPGT